MLNSGWRASSVSSPWPFLLVSLHTFTLNFGYERAPALTVMELQIDPQQSAIATTVVNRYSAY